MATPAPHTSSPAPPSPNPSTTSRRSQRPPRPSPSPRPPSFLPSLPPHQIRDFAYPTFHPLHLGPPSPSTPTSTTSTPARRLSDPLDAWPPPSLPGSTPDGIEPDVLALPSTSFGDEEGWRRSHRKSRSQATLADFDRERERGRRRSSARRSREGGLGGDSLFHFGAAGFDPAGSGGLRSSRGQAPGRRDSHWHPTARSSHFASSQQRLQEDAIPLDTEPSLHAHSPQRASMGPEDEELFAGESLALYSFEPENSNELRLREGQVILVSYRHGQGWLVAEDPRTGEQGLVPEEYVRLVREIEGWDSEKGVFVGEDEGAEGEGEGGDGEESGEVSRTEFGADGVSGGSGSREEEESPKENEASEAMLVDPPEIDHQQGLQMKNVSKTPVKGGGGRGGEEGEVRQDSACAER